jgi:hypothetical protein
MYSKWKPASSRTISARFTCLFKGNSLFSFHECDSTQNVFEMQIIHAYTSITVRVEGHCSDSVLFSNDSANRPFQKYIKRFLALIALQILWLKWGGIRTMDRLISFVFTQVFYLHFAFQKTLLSPGVCLTELGLTSQLKQPWNSSDSQNTVKPSANAEKTLMKRSSSVPPGRIK